MTIYEISWAWYEEEIHSILEHEQEFSEQELQKMFREAYCEVLDRLLAIPNYGWIGLEDAFYSCAEGVKVADIMCERYGFREAKPIRACEYGEAIIDGDTEDDEEIRAWVGEDRYQAIVQHNREFRESLYGRLRLGTKEPKNE